jgi:hypothetical protein
MQIEVITPGALGRAEAVLCRGFPYRPPGFWKGVLGALEAYRAARGAGPIGTLLVDQGEDVGVLLTLDSPAGAGGRRKLNLSSWYVDQRARFWAPLMLRAALAAGELVTDLSPTREVEAVNERLGITGRVRGSMIVPTPFDSFRPSGAALRRELPEGGGELLRDHLAMGMLCATLVLPDGQRQPLIFLRTRLRGLPGARLIYCDSLSHLRRHRGVIARFLFAQGLLFLEIEANRAATWPGALYAARRCRVFAKGELPADAIDHSYTELTFLHQHAARAA